MNVGLALTCPYPASVSPITQFAQQREIVRTARDLGFSYVGLGQHYLAEDIRYYQPIPYLAALAEDAGDMRLVVGVILLPLHNPVDIAEQVATLDAVSGGRAVLGLGLGYVDRELTAFGVARSDRIARFEEAVPLIRRLWAGERVDHDGNHFRVPNAATAALPVQQPGPSIWIGAQADPSVRRAARVGDAWYCAPFPSHREVNELLDVFLDERSTHGLGPPSEFPLRREVFVGRTYEDAAQAARDGAGRRYQTYGDWGLDLGGTDVPLPEPGTDQWLDSRLVLGTADDVVAQLEWLQTRTGFTSLGIKVQWPDLGHAQAMDQLEWFGTEVLPRLQ